MDIFGIKAFKYVKIIRNGHQRSDAITIYGWTLDNFWNCSTDFVEIALKHPWGQSFQWC